MKNSDEGGMALERWGGRMQWVRSVVAGILLLTLHTTLQAQYEYTTNNGTITITKYTGPGGVVSIPDTINDLPVTCIGGSAFAGRASLTSVTIPDSVVNIGDYAFAWCNGLTTVTILDSATRIGEGSFFWCYSLTTVTIGNSVMSIGYRAFALCYSLANVAMGKGVTSIGGSAFERCISLASVAIPSGVTNIGDSAFGGCISLTAITVDTLNPSYSSVDGALFDKGQTTLITYPEGRVGSYSIPKSVTSIKGGAFQYCAGLTTVTIPNSVTSIGAWAFRGCNSLTGVTIPNSVTWVGEAAFHQCPSLTSVTVGNGVARINEITFESCTNLTSVVLGSSVTGIESGAFGKCTGLRGAYFEGSVPKLTAEGVWEAFAGDINATVYYLPGRGGWGKTFGGRPTAPWVPANLLVLNSGPSFGLQSKGFSFLISCATNLSVVVEATTDLANPVWVPLLTNHLSDGALSFADGQWTNSPTRFYRVRSP